MAAFAATSVPVRAAAFSDSARGRASDTVRAAAARKVSGRPIQRSRDVRVGVIDPVSIMVGGAMVTAGRSLLEKSSHDEPRAVEADARDRFDVDVTPERASDSKSGDFAGVARAGELPSIAHTYAGVFDAAASGALSSVVNDVITGGWWDGAVNARDARPVLELQAMRADARAALVDAVRDTLRSAFKTYAPEEGKEAEAAQDLLAVVAETAAKEWLRGTESQEDATMVRRAGDLAARLVNAGDAESPGSKSALYVNLLAHMASLARFEDNVISEDVVTSEDEKGSMELVSAARRLAANDDARFAFSMAAVSTSVLEDATVRVAESVASAYLSRVREGASAPSRAVAKKAGAAKAARTAAVAAVSAASVVRHALALQPRLKSTRALEKFRNEVKLAAWMNANYGDVVAMYEDWHSLMGVDAAGNVVTRKISVCRHSELARVTGARMLMSMFLEFSDVVVPVARAALNNVKNFTSWLLVTLIGRSLGLVYRGIKESMNGTGNGNKNGGAPARFA
jgi:hypothetical protein